MLITLLDDSYLNRLFQSVYGGYSTIAAGAIDEISEALDHVAAHIMYMVDLLRLEGQVSSSNMMEAIKRVMGPKLTRNIAQVVNKAFTDKPPGKDLKIATDDLLDFTYTDAANLVMLCATEYLATEILFLSVAISGGKTTVQASDVRFTLLETDCLCLSRYTGSRPTSEIDILAPLLSCSSRLNRLADFSSCGGTCLLSFYSLL